MSAVDGATPPRSWVAASDPKLYPSGVRANRQAIDTFLRHHFEQGLSKRGLACEDIFVPEFLGTWHRAASSWLIDSLAASWRD